MDPTQHIDANTLSSAYNNSVTNSPELHHPGITAGTASDDHVRRDFSTWLAGVRSSTTDPQLRQQVCSQQSAEQAATSSQYRQSLPDNARQALQQFISQYSGRRMGRAA